MAAKTPDRVELGTVNGNRLLRGIFTTANIDDADTWDTGIDSIVNVAWKATNATDLVAATHAAGVVTFASTGNDHNGECWIEAKGY